jgi:calcineurin-like phosphoesterase
MRILFIGDIVGRSGRNAVLNRLPGLRRDWQLISSSSWRERGRRLRHHGVDLQRIADAGADAITLATMPGSARGAGIHRARPKLIRPINIRRHPGEARPSSMPRTARVCW